MLGYQLCSFSHELFFCNSCESELTNEFFAVGSRVRNQTFWHDQLSDNGKPNIYNHATHPGSLCLLALSVIKLAFIPLFLYCNAAPSNRHVTHVSFAHKKVKLGGAIFKIYDTNYIFRWLSILIQLFCYSTYSSL